ncbi:MAG: DUF3575 domain-containing protein [Cytophagia bacterium]|nr:MAG: DUF3575 domain-containing protein [Cytophagia bacterium]TAG44661.1 MAG: DUF3575 domain-containing protein [Cytophagia bacterium]
MKKIVALLFCVMCINFIQAQDTDKKNIVKLNPIAFGYSSFNVSYERVFTDKMTAQISFFYFGRSSDPSIYGPTGGWGITPECRFYLTETKTAPTGFFLAPFLTLQGLTYNYSINEGALPTLALDNRRGTAKSTMFGIGGIVGYQWIFKDIITAEVYAGPGFGLASMNSNKAEHGNIRENSNIGTNALFPFVKQTGPILRFGATLGFIF